MNALLIDIEENMKILAPYRKAALFNEFLVKGYTAVTLSSVPENKFSDLLRAKLCLGTLITLYDDFADRPETTNPEVLAKLYELSIEKPFSGKLFNDYNSKVIEFASMLFNQISDILKPLPNYKEFIDILHFDLMQFYTANQYSSLVLAKPYLNNSKENRMYTHHNMGMVCVAMMDLMATEKIELTEMKAIREVLLLGQRMGRIFNILTTYKREALDGDTTSELSVYKTQVELGLAIMNLRQEITDLHLKILVLDQQVKSFSVKDYAHGLLMVQKLHEKMEGTI